MKRKKFDQNLAKLKTLPPKVMQINKCYVWNRGKSSFDINSLKIEMYIQN